MKKSSSDGAMVDSQSAQQQQQPVMVATRDEFINSVANVTDGVPDAPTWDNDPDFIDPNEEVPDVATWLTIRDCPALPKEGLISFSAKVKQGKSLSVLALLMPILTGMEFDTAIPTGERPNHVIVFDTEMFKKGLIKRAKMVCTKLGEDSQRLRFASTKGLPRTERMAKIEEKIMQYNPEIAVIDQAADLVSNINSEEQATEIGEWLTSIADNRTVILVIHQNKADDNERGHLGSIINHKVVEAYTTANRHGVITITPKYSRDSGLCEEHTMTFAVSEQGNIISANDILLRNKERECEQQVKDLMPIFGSDEVLNRHEIVSRIMQQEHISDRAADSRVTEATKVGAIIKVDPTKHRSPYTLKR